MSDIVERLKHKYGVEYTVGSDPTPRYGMDKHPLIGNAILELDRLRAEVASLKEEHDRVLAANKDCLLHFDTLKTDYDTLTQQLAAANSRVERMREALEKYGQHDRNCQAITESGCPPCNCGFDDAISDLPEAAPIRDETQDFSDF